MVYYDGIKKNELLYFSIPKLFFKISEVFFMLKTLIFFSITLIFFSIITALLTKLFSPSYYLPLKIDVKTIKSFKIGMIRLKVPDFLYFPKCVTNIANAM